MAYNVPYIFRAAKSVTKSDTTADPLGPFDWVWVDVAGDVKVTLAGGDTVVFAACPVGPLFAEVSRVWSTGTGATVTVAGR